MAIINFPILYIPDPAKGRPLFSGQIFVGIPDLDPEIPSNQKQLNVVQEDGTVVAVGQPFILSSGGVPTYNGATVRLDVEGNYSLKILDKNGAQTYYIHNVFEGEPITELEAIARSLNVLDSQVIYSTDTTTVLDNVLYIYDQSAQITYSIPVLNGTGETIISLTSNKLTTTGFDAYNLARAGAPALRDTPELIAHRGFVQVNVQNTLPSIRSAKLSGADALEMDVQVSLDGTPYLFHDNTVDSLTDGTGAISSLTDAQIDALEYTQAIGTQIEGVGIPTFSAALKEIAKQSGRFYPEIKSGDVATIVNEVKTARLSGRCVWQSFSLSDLTDAFAIDPNASYGYLINDDLAGMEAAIDSVSVLGDNFHILLQYANVLANPSIVEYAKSSGVDIAVWTVDNKNDYESLLEIGVYSIMSNRNLK